MTVVVANRAALWFPLLLLLLLQALFLARADWAVLHGSLFDPDAYTRLNRVIALHESGDWYGIDIARANAPYGEGLHWTRPLDVLLLAGAVPLSLVIEFKTALHWWGVALSPVLHALALIAMLWAARPLIGQGRLVYAGVLFLCQPALAYYFLPGRPDHHSLLLLLFVLTFGLLLRLVERPYERRLAATAGVAAATALWVSLESLGALAWLLLSFGVLWTVFGADLARKALTVSLALAGGAAGALLIERPPDEFFVAVYDRLSIVHVLGLTLVAVIWRAVLTIERGSALAQTWPRRALLGGVGAMAVVAVQWLVFPKTFGGPLVEVDPRAITLWVTRISEVEPLWRDAQPIDSVKRTLIFLGPALLALPILAARLREAAEARRAWLAVALALALFVPAALFVDRGVRWAAYAGAAAVIPYALLLSWALERARAWRPIVPRSLVRATVVLAFGVGFVVLGQLIPAPASAGRPASAPTAACPVQDMAEHLNEDYAQTPRRVLSFVFIGPELIYRTDHAFVASSYLRDPEGLFDTLAFFTAADDEGEPRRVIEERAVDLVLLCPESNEAALYAGAPGARTLFDRLVDDDVPAWLTPVDLPAPLAAFRLYEVAGR